MSMNAKKLLTAVLTVSMVIAPAAINANAVNEEKSQNPVMNYVGDYAYGRAKITVEAGEDNQADLTVIWGNSAYETYEWKMTGEFDEETASVVYTYGIKESITYDENGEATREEIYNDGTGKIVFADDTLTWTDDKENVAEDTVFTFIKPLEELNPVTEFEGDYFLYRAKISVKAAGENGAEVTVHWPSSAYEYGNWQMTGVFDAENSKIVYTNGIKEITKYETPEEKTVTEVYNDGTGEIIFSGNTLVWKDDKEGIANDSVFTLGEKIENPQPNPALNVEGDYVFGRAKIAVRAAGADGIDVTIKWANSAFETYQWKMTGKFDAETSKVVYTDGIKQSFTYDENGEETITDIYDNGTGEFVFSENTLTWKDDKEGVANDTVFSLLVYNDDTSTDDNNQDDSKTESENSITDSQTDSQTDNANSTNNTANDTNISITETSSNSTVQTIVSPNTGDNTMMYVVGSIFSMLIAAAGIYVSRKVKVK